MRIAILAGEESGDGLGAALMSAMAATDQIEWFGVGGDAMAAAGLRSIFAQDEISVMGLDAIIRRLPQLLRRIAQAAREVVAFSPDALIIIDAPEFTHRVAKRVRKALPQVPIINYVSPTVWAWRPGRARAMRPYVDHVLCLFPFEPEVHQRLGGPPASYVGHPLFETERRPEAPVGGHLLILPGSRRGEISRLLPVFGETLAQLDYTGSIDLLAVPRLRTEIEAAVTGWDRPVDILSGEGAKELAFGRAFAALAASGTITFELAARRIPMSVAYKLDFTYRQGKRLHPGFPIVTSKAMVLANIILGRNLVPEFLEEAANPAELAAAMSPLLQAGSAERAIQAEAFEEVSMAMAVARSPAEQAAEVVRQVLQGQ